jgi:Ser-tRNA(Ala) deacylase AlaX
LTPYSLEITEKRGYLHARVTGDNTKENVMRYMNELARECNKARCRCVLVEEQLEGPRLDTMSVFDIATDGSEKSRAVFRAIAYVDVFAETSSMKNAESFANNRGLNVRVFGNVAEAEKWLGEFAT